MKNKFNLEINKPCSENFNSFTPTKSGGFCNSCQEEVVDFTGMSSQEIITYFKENSGKSTCGRFTDYQLGSYTKTKYKSKNYSFWKGLGLACVSFFTFNTIQAQEITKTELISQKSNNKSLTQEQRNILVKGTVSDELAPLADVNILLQGTTIGTTTDLDGNFEFPKKLKKGDVLLFSFIGLETKRVVITDKSSKVTMLNVTMKNDSCILMGKIAVKKPYKSNKKF